MQMIALMQMKSLLKTAQVWMYHEPNEVVETDRDPDTGMGLGDPASWASVLVNEHDQSPTQTICPLPLRLIGIGDCENAGPGPGGGRCWESLRCKHWREMATQAHSSRRILPAIRPRCGYLKGWGHEGEQAC